MAVEGSWRTSKGSETESTISLTNRDAGLKKVQLRQEKGGGKGEGPDSDPGGRGEKAKVNG